MSLGLTSPAPVSLRKERTTFVLVLGLAFAAPKPPSAWGGGERGALL